MEKLNRFKLLCVTREGFWGMNNINQIIETQLQVNQRKEEFYHKQPIMITENNLSLGIFNGDIGFITAKLNEHSELIFESHFWIENQIKTFPTLHLQSYETAFAMTIHKSQGSEYEKVFIFLPQKENHPLLCRELLYTAVTRSKKHCFVYGEQSTLDFAVSRKIQRMSGILSRW
jgi:exodeoxyribonuclease V alpha subunit